MSAAGVFHVKPAAAGGARLFHVKQRTTLRAFVDLLLHWNRRINLVGAAIGRGRLAPPRRSTPCNSLPLLPPAHGPLVDLGSGAGFPGLVLAMRRPVARRTSSKPTSARPPS